MSACDKTRTVSVLFMLLVAASVQAQDPQNRLYIEPQTVEAGSSTVRVPVLMDNAETIYGFQLSLIVNGDRLELKEVSFEDTATGNLCDGCAQGKVEPRGDDVHLSWGVVFELPQSQEEFEDRKIPPGEGLVLANLLFDVNGTAGGQVAIRFVDFLDEVPPAKNALFRDFGLRLEMTTGDGLITLPAGADAPFVRGDVNASGGAPDLTDGIFGLNFLFFGGEELTCDDAFDTNDDGTLELTDAIYLLNFLFLGGDPVPPPVGECSLDPTPEELTCLSFAACP